MVKTKSQKVLETKSYVCRSYRGKTGRGAFLAPPPTWIGLNERSFLQKAGFENNEILKKCSYEGLNFIYSNWQDVCSVEFTNYPWKRHHWQHHFFISEVKSSNTRSMPKETGSTFGLPPRIVFITWKCWYNILWIPLLAPNTIALHNPLKNSLITCVNELIF